MDIGSIFLILALLLLVALFVSRPFFEKAAPPTMVQPASAEHDRSSLLAERDRILTALQELDFDYALGKIPEADYPEERARLKLAGANVLRRLDELVPDSDHEDAESRLEAAVAARRSDGVAVQAVGGNGRKSAVAVTAADDDLETLLANRRRERREKAGGFCPQCGKAIQRSDRFCPKCGEKIS